MSDTQNGLNLKLEATKTSGLPAFKATITNVSSEPILFCAYQAKHRLRSRMNADGYEVFVFEPTPKPPISADDYVKLGPGQTLSYNLEFGKDGYEWLWAGSRPPTVLQSSAAKQLPKGKYTFIAHIGDHITLSTAPSGQSGSKERLNILNDIEKAASPPGPCWTGDLVARCEVDFG